MKNITIRNFTGDIREIFAYLMSRYQIISPSYLNYFKIEVIDIHYDTVTPVDNIFNKIKDLLKYGYRGNCPYSHPQSISKAYNILNKTIKFRNSFGWINFKV